MSVVLDNLEEILQEHIVTFNKMEDYLNEREEFYEFFSEQYYLIDREFKHFMSSLGAKLIGSGGIGILLKLDKYDDVCLKYCHSHLSVKDDILNHGFKMVDIGYSNFYINIVEEFLNREGLLNSKELLPSVPLHERYKPFEIQLNMFNPYIAEKYLSGSVDLFNSLPESLRAGFVNIYYSDRTGENLLIEYKDSLDIPFEDQVGKSHCIHDDKLLISYLEDYKELHKKGFFFTDLHLSNLGIDKVTLRPIYFDLDCFRFSEELIGATSVDDDYHEVLRTTHSFINVRDFRVLENLVEELHAPDYNGVFSREYFR